MSPLKFLDPRSFSEQLDEVFKGVFSASKKASHISTSPLALSTPAPNPPTNSVICEPSSAGPEALAAFARDRRRYSIWDRFASQIVDKQRTSEVEHPGARLRSFQSDVASLRTETINLRTEVTRLTDRLDTR